MRDYIDLTKPRITWLIMMSTAVGYFFGCSGVHGWVEFLRHLDCWQLFHTLVGTGLMASGTAALNQWYEWDVDAKMRRTAGRPIPSGNLSPARALVFGTVVSTAGFLELLLGVNGIAAVAGLATLTSYLFLYTPLKTRSWWCTTIGAFPGAMPPVIGFAAGQGSLSPEAIVLFSILLLWQFPHFYSIAWMYREDYARAGIRMLPVVEPDCVSTARQMLGGALLLLPFSFIPVTLHMAGRFYALTAVLLGVGFVAINTVAVLRRTRATAHGVLRASIIYLPLLLCAMVLDRSW